MIYTVTFNPSIDYFVTVDKLQTGKTNRAKTEFSFPGGKGINVSMVLANLGVESIALGFTAGYIGNTISNMLEKYDIRTDFIHLREGNSRINLKIHSDVETELNGIGPNISEEDIDTLLRKFEEMQKDDMVVLSGSVPMTIDTSIYAKILDILNSIGIKCVVDATGDLLSKALGGQPYLVKPNIDELVDFFGCEIEGINEVVDYARRLQTLGAKNVLVSMGAEGAVLVSENGLVYSDKVPAGTVINTVGAGDSMVAGFLYGINKHHDYEKAFYTALCAGSASAFNTGMATKEAVSKLLEQFGRTI